MIKDIDLEEKKTGREFAGKRNVTMKDVARIADVSQATVSYVINRSAPISSEVQKKVNDAIKITGYQPNFMAQNLKRGKSWMVGVLVNDMKNSYYASVVEELERFFVYHGYFMVSASSNHDVKMEELYLNRFIQLKVDGIILTSLTNKFLYPKLAKTNIPLVLLDDDPQEITIPHIHVQNRTAAFYAVEYLYKTGCRKIGFVSEPMQKRALCERYEGFCMAYKKNGNIFYEDDIILVSNVNDIPYDDKEYNCTEKNAVMDFEEAAIEIKTRGYDGIFVTSDYSALYLMKELKKLGVIIPHELSIIGFDGLKIADLVSPLLTTMIQPTDEICQECGEMLIGIIEKGAYKKKKKFLAKIRVGETTKGS